MLSNHHMARGERKAGPAKTTRVVDPPRLTGPELVQQTIDALYVELRATASKELDSLLRLETGAVIAAHLGTGPHMGWHRDTINQNVIAMHMAAEDPTALVESPSGLVQMHGGGLLRAAEVAAAAERIVEAKLFAQRALAAEHAYGAALISAFSEPRARSSYTIWKQHGYTAKAATTKLRGAQLEEDHASRIAHINAFLTRLGDPADEHVERRKLLDTYYNLRNRMLGSRLGAEVSQQLCSGNVEDARRTINAITAEASISDVVFNYPKNIDAAAGERLRRHALETVETGEVWTFFSGLTALTSAQEAQRRARMLTDDEQLAAGHLPDREGLPPLTTALEVLAEAHVLLQSTAAIARYTDTLDLWDQGAVIRVVANANAFADVLKNAPSIMQRMGSGLQLNYKARSRVQSTWKNGDSSEKQLLLEASFAAAVDGHPVRLSVQMSLGKQSHREKTPLHLGQRAAESMPPQIRDIIAQSTVCDEPRPDDIMVENKGCYDAAGRFLSAGQSFDRGKAVLPVMPYQFRGPLIDPYGGSTEQVTRGERSMNVLEVNSRCAHPRGTWHPNDKRSSHVTGMVLRCPDCRRAQAAIVPLLSVPAEHWPTMEEYDFSADAAEQSRRGYVSRTPSMTDVRAQTRIDLIRAGVPVAQLEQRLDEMTSQRVSLRPADHASGAEDVAPDVPTRRAPRRLRA